MRKVKMKKVLYMHTGSGNHGCEALVRTISKLLEGPSDIFLWSLTKTEDEYYGSANVVEEVFMSEQIKRYSPAYFEAAFRRKILRQLDANKKVFLKNLFKDRIAISIGGDNYCYSWSAQQAVDLDKEIRKYCEMNVLWGCSIDPEAITPEIQDDLAGFDLITARESITFQALKKINSNTIQVADSAFLLETENLPLPNTFIEGNTVGINISPLIMQYSTQSCLILKNYERLIEYILKKTDMNICLIPHVVWEYNDDRVPCYSLYGQFKNTNRVSMIQDGNCMQLKGYISRCRFFIGARTHATIAAYSSLVPTLVIGYSVKSRGIAQDIFGTDKNYVLPVQSLIGVDDLLKKFQWLLAHEQQQRNALKQIMPEYIQRAKFAESALTSFIKR